MGRGDGRQALAAAEDLRDHPRAARCRQVGEGQRAAERLLDDVASDEGRGVERTFLFPPGLGVLAGGGLAATLEVLADAFSEALDG